LRKIIGSEAHSARGDAAIENRVAACANISLAPFESVYRWKKKIEVSREYLLVMKTVGARVHELRRVVHDLHSYDVPEFVVLPIVGGSDKYLRWLAESVSRATRGRT
jgi:periplasmic divalent cation tolerance protein